MKVSWRLEDKHETQPDSRREVRRFFIRQVISFLESAIGLYDRELERDTLWTYLARNESLFSFQGSLFLTANKQEMIEPMGGNR